MISALAVVRISNRIRIVPLIMAVVIGRGVAQAQTQVDDFNPGANNPVRKIVVQPDGRILAMDWGLHRHNSDGLPDAGFSCGGCAFDMAVQPDGRIVAGGYGSVVRLSTAGSLDTSFDVYTNGDVVAVEAQTDGKILIGGMFTTVSRTASGLTIRHGLARLNNDGSVDAGFNPAFFSDSVFTSIALQADGRILVTGAFTPVGGNEYRYIARLHSDGSLDTSFDVRADGPIESLAIQPDGRIVVGGSFNRLSGNGMPGFATRQYIGRFNGDGSLDMSFEPNPDGSVQSLAIQPDGRILVGGHFRSLRNQSRYRLGRIYSDGSLDTRFNPGANNGVVALALQTDGAILVGGYFDRLGGGGEGMTPRQHIGRLEATPDRVVVGLGSLQENGGWIATRTGSAGSFDLSTWLRVPWPAYNATGGGLRVAAGDVDGDGLDEIVAGLGSGGDGWLAVFDDAAHGYAFLKWIKVSWPGYNATNGEVWPAVGDVDGDGKAEIVAGLGTGGAGWFEIFDDAAGNFEHLAWRQVSWPTYNANNGATHPTIGNVDGVGASEIIIGLGSSSVGWMEVMSDAASGFSHQSWVQVQWSIYSAANGTTFPAAGDLDGDGRAEIVVGLGSGGEGWLEVFEDATNNFAHARWLRTSWTNYNQWSSGETHPAVGNIDRDDRAEIVIGLDVVPGDSGWFEALDDGLVEYRSLGWQNLEWEPYRSAGGPTFPAIGRFR